MTKAARTVLADCEDALAELTHGVQGSAWRRRWVNAVVLLRAVGHVLESVDSELSAEYRAVIARRWNALRATQPEPLIFWRFICDERNNLVREYRFAAGQGVTVRPGLVEVDTRTGEQTASAGLPPMYRYLMIDGPFKGEDQSDVLRRAIEWWQEYLDAIDAEAATLV